MRHPTSEIERQTHSFLYYRDTASYAQERKNSARDALKDHVASNGEPDENGHLRWMFPEAIVINEVKYIGLMNQRRKSTGIDEDAALELAERKGVLEEITTYVPVYDWDQLYVLNQQGKLTDEELDSIVEVRETWALVPIEA